MTIASADNELRHPITLRKDTPMQLMEQLLRDAEERQTRIREQRQAARIAMAAQAERRAVRRQVGETIIRIGHRVAGESLGKPALSG